MEGQKGGGGGILTLSRGMGGGWGHGGAEGGGDGGKGHSYFEPGVGRAVTQLGSTEICWGGGRKRGGGVGACILPGARSRAGGSAARPVTKPAPQVPRGGGASSRAARYADISGPAWGGEEGKGSRWGEWGGGAGRRVEARQAELLRGVQPHGVQAGEGRGGGMRY